MTRRRIRISRFGLCSRKNLDAACSELAMLGNRFPDSEHKYEMLDKDTYEECEVKTSFLVVPQQFAGALIGPKGSNVKKVAQDCGAFIYIQQPTAGTAPSHGSRLRDSTRRTSRQLTRR